MQDLRITFLGTSAGIPTRDRNVAAVAIIMDGRTLLFDCGEATQHQLMRSPIRPGTIEAVCISHLHGDHLFGLPGLLASLSLNGREAPLAMYGPPGISAFLRSLPLYHTSFDVQVHELGSSEVPFEIRRAAGYRVDAVSVEHTAPCFAYRIVEDDRPGAFDAESARARGVREGPLFGRLQRGSDVTLADGRRVRSREVVGPPRRGRRIVYCTDTRPCAASIALARGATVLIHESTYAAELSGEALERKHSTAAEAASIAAEAGVERLILTHISPRYRDPGPLLAEARANFANTEVAEDLATFEVARQA